MTTRFNGRYDPWHHSYYSKFRPGSSHHASSKQLKICFVLGSADISGGTYVVLQHAMYALSQGAQVTLATIFGHDRSNQWHPVLQHIDPVDISTAAASSYDIVIATWWRTVFDLPKFRSRHFVYFVQSAENRFYHEPTSLDASGLAELTYTLDLPVITIARWLQLHLAWTYRRPSFVVNNGIRKDLYSPVGPTVEPRPHGHTRFLVEGPVDVPMKNVQKSIDLLRDGGAKDVWMLTSSDVSSFTGVDRVFSRVPITSTPSIYRSCDVLVKLSRVEGMYGPPLEMFHCGGTVITYDVTGHEEYVVHQQNGLVADMDDESQVLAYIEQLRDDVELVSQLKFGALATASRWPDWTESSRLFWNYLTAFAELAPYDNGLSLLAARGASLDL